MKKENVQRALRTANEAAVETMPPGMLLGISISANAIAPAREIPPDGWYPISTFGEHPSPDRTYVQVFDRGQAEETVKTWNSIAGRAFRWLKNVRHRLEPKFTVPIVELAHIDTDPRDYSKLQTLGDLTDLRVTANSLEGFVKWDRVAMANRAPGPLYPSVLWWHDRPNAEKKVFPVHIESVALVRDPNITSVPAWTQNASPYGEEDPKTNNQNPMNEEQLKALRKALNLPDTTDVAKVIETAQSAFQLSTSNASALTKANSDKDELGKQLTTLNQQVGDEKKKVTDLTKERDDLRTANGVLVDQILNVFESNGKITAAQRPDVKARFTANDAKPADIVKELTEKKPELNTKVIELNNNRVDISTANARQTALEAAIQKRMKDDGLKDDERGIAYDRVKADPTYKQLFEAMDSAKKAAA